MTILAADWVLPVDAPPVRGGAVALDGARIATVGPANELGPPDAVFKDAVIVPGFVNAHSHLEYAVYAGFGDARPFGEWLSLHVQRKHLLALDEMAAVARLGAAECLRSGVTSVGDASYSGAAAVACAELGLRATVYIEVFGPGTGHIVERFEAHRARIADMLSARVRVGISPHSVYTASLELWQAAIDLHLPLMTHFAETKAELEWARTGRGPLEAVRPTSIRELAKHGLLPDRLIAAHCVHVDDEEVRLLAAHDVAIAHCPRSNAILGCGIAPLRRLLDEGVRVGIGTDSPASTPSFDMFEELRTAIYAARAREERADALTAAEALELATLGGARALGLEDEFGSLTPGKQADLAVVSLAGSPYLPWEDPTAGVVFGGAPHRVLLTVVDGEIRYENGVTEWQDLIDAAASVRGRMLAAASPPHALHELA
jgi:cytosine/adenosine deaminase-related metal-dependent hydrolase